MAIPVFSYPGELLHQAAIFDQRDFLKSLLQSGVQGDANSKDPRGLTPVHTAALHDSAQCLEELLGPWKGDPNAVSGPQDNCSTPLHLAARNGHLKCLKLLVDSKGDVSKKNKTGKTAREVAISENHYECADYLKNVEEIQKAVREEECCQELFLACTIGDFEKVSTLIPEISQINVNRLFHGGSTLLYKAAHNGHLEIVQLLLNHGADGSANTYTGITPLYASCFNKHVKVTKLLAHAMPHHVNTPTKMEHSTPLHVAAGEGSVDIVKILMQAPEEGTSPMLCNGIDINARTSSGMTPLHLAASGGHAEVAKLLLEGKHCCIPPCSANVGIEINAQSIMGRTPLHDSITVGQRDIVKILLEAGADVNLSYNPDQISYTQEPKNEISRVVQKLAEDVRDEEKTPLGIACAQGDLEVVRILVEAGAVDIGNTCVEKASKALHHSLVHILLSKGVNIDNEHKLPHPSRGSHAEEVWRLNSNPICIVWNGMKLNQIHPQWIVDAAKQINPQVASGNVGLHPVLKTITRLDISGNALNKLPLIIFQLPSLKVLNISENSLNSLPTLHNGRVRTQLGNTSGNPIKFHSCDNITDRVTEEIEDSDFNYAESSWNCPHLEEIEMHHNSLPSLPTCIFELPTLRFLNASYNDIDSLPFAMWFSPMLKTLDLKGNYLKTLPLSDETKKKAQKAGLKTSTLPRPRHVSKSRDDLSKQLIPEQEGGPSEEKPSETKKISADGSKPKDDHVPQPAKPQHLKIFCHSKLWGKNGVEELEDSDEDEDEIEQTRGHALLKLDLSHNQFKIIPLGLPCLATNLQTLNLSNNYIFEVKTLAYFPTSLASLDLSNNRLEEMSPLSTELPVKRCYAVVERQRGGLGMSTRPRSASKSSLKGRACRHQRHRTLPNLKRLDVNNNSIKEMTFSKMEANVTSNTPTRSQTGSKYAAWFASTANASTVIYPSLQSLNLSGNPLVTLPKTIGLLSKLGSLHISNTEVSKLPPEIGLLSDLWDLQYLGLTLQDIEASVLERKKTKDLVSYLRSVLERSRPYPCMKLMFVGVSNIGKTTLLNQLRQEGTGSYQSSPSTGWTERKKRKRGSSLGRSKKQEKNISTVGVDVSDWTYPKKNEFFRGDQRQSIKFSTWDFGGQREYYATHQCFLSHRSLYIVMWKLTEGEKGVNEIEPWLLNIQARAPDSPCIIVGTHHDMLTPEERRSNLLPTLQQMIRDRYIAREFGGGVQNPRDRGLPKVMNTIEVSSKTGYHVRELRHMIYNKALEIKERGSRTPLLETPIPASYIYVEEVVGKIRDCCYQDDQTPVMRSENFRNAVQKELGKQGRHLRDLEELEQATKFLHDNGVLLHYDDPLLRDLYFLDPQWLCDMLAHVVTIREVNPHINNGVMKLSDLSHIFRSENFPANLIKQYINLLSKFEVALPWSAEYLLVPSLLPDRQQISNQPISPEVSPIVSRAMNMAAYTKTRVLRRQYVMSYVPSGFWPRLITRIIADEEVRDVVRSCCQLVMEGEAVETDKEKLASVAQPDWSCWKTGVELSCFGVKMLRICDLEGYPFYGAPEGAFYPLHYRNEPHDPTSYSTIAIIAPCVNILMEKFVQKKRISRRRSGKHPMNRRGDDDDDNPPESRQVIGFRVKSVTDFGVQLAARLLAIVVEHFDTLITDWFPGLDALTVHGYRLVSRITPCPKCIKEVSGVEDDPEGDCPGDVPYTQQNDSGAHLTTDGSSASASPWPSPVHAAIKRDPRIGATSPDKRSSLQSQGSTTGELTPDPFGETPLSPPFIQVPDGSPPDRFTFKSVSSGLGTNDSSSYFEDTSDQTSGSADEPDTDCSGEPNTQKGRKGKNKRPMIGSSGSDRSRGSEEFNSHDSKASHSSSDHQFGSQTDSQRSRGSTESTSSFNRSGRYGSFRRRPTESDTVIYAFEFEECVLSAYNAEPIKCPDHGLMNLREIAPDVMFEDIAPNLAIHSGNLTRGRFLGKGTFGSVFRGELKGAAGDSLAIAMKMPLNNDVGEDAKPEERQAAEAAKRALRDNPTMALNDAYRTVRQEISILLPLRHPNIVSLTGFCLSPLCMVIEFAPLGALDRVLANYKRAGARLNPYVIQKCIVQCSSALKYLHKHHIIYRDLKSENILVWTFPQPHADQGTHEVFIKLADYGISRTAALAGMKGLGGTPGFMAPEIEKYVGKECYTDKVDTFSFGMYIYELLTLHQPFCDFSPAQVKQMIVEGQRPPLTPKDRKGPVFAMDLMAWCWEQDSDKRPTSAQVYAFASLPEFARLTDVLTFDKQLNISCAVTAGSRVTSGCGADGRPSVGNEVWLCRSELNAGTGTGKINVVKYSGGRFSHKEELTVGKSCIRVACSVGSTVWLGTESGTLHVYCGITYRELCKGVIKRAKYILSMAHIPRCNWVLVSLADGSILAYDDNICNHYYYGDSPSHSPKQELLPSRGYPGNGNPIHCIASVPVMYPRITDPTSAEDTTRVSPEPTEDYICEVWCGQEKGEITVLDGEELQKISTMPAEDSDSEVTILKEQSVSHLVTCRTFKSAINNDDPLAKSVWVALYPGTRVFRWDAQEKRTVRSVDCASYKPKFEVPKSGKGSLQRTGCIRQGQLSAVRAQVNSLLAVDKELYIGTNWGCILVCDNLSLTVYSVIRCHEETLSYLLPLVSSPVGVHSNTHNALVMSFGGGYRNIGAGLHGNNPYPSRRSGKPLGRRESVILVWLADSWDTS